MSVRDARTPEAVFAALGDGTRLALLRRLSGGNDCSIAMLAADTALTRQAVTKHLRILEGAGLVQQRRSGRERRFAYRPEPVAEARTYLAAVAGHWDAALERLRAHLGE